MVNKTIVGMYRGTGRIKGLQIGPCSMSVDFADGTWMKGNHVAHATTPVAPPAQPAALAGIVDLDVWEQGNPRASRDGAVQEPWADGAFIQDPPLRVLCGLGLPRVRGALTVIGDFGGQRVAETLEWAGPYAAGAGEDWCVAGTAE